MVIKQPETSDKTCVEPNTMQPKPSQGQNNGPPIIPQQWMPIPTKIPGCPPGLEYLTVLDQLLIHQDVELVEGQVKLTLSNLVWVVLLQQYTRKSVL